MKRAQGLAHSAGPYLNRPTKAVEELTLGAAAAKNASRVLAQYPLNYSAKVLTRHTGVCEIIFARDPMSS